MCTGSSASKASAHNTPWSRTASQPSPSAPTSSRQTWAPVAAVVKVPSQPANAAHAASAAASSSASVQRATVSSSSRAEVMVRPDSAVCWSSASVKRPSSPSPTPSVRDSAFIRVRGERGVRSSPKERG